MFRILLATVVFASHSSRFDFGSAAVDVFFVLSGFWIYKMWVARYAITKHSYLTYLISRSWRLLPVFLLASATILSVNRWLYSSIIPIGDAGNRIHFVLSHILILGYNSLPVGPLGPAWSLDFEMQFYLVAPALVWFIMRLRRPMLVLFGAGISSLGSALCFGKYSLASHLIFFIVGMLAARFDWKPSARIAISSVASVISFVAICLLCRQFSGLQLNAIISFLAIPYAIFTTRQPSNKFDKMLGDLSYVVYLLHWPGEVLCGRYGGFHKRLYMWGVWLTVYPLSFVIWRLYDLPINQLRTQWVNRRRRIAAVQAADHRHPIAIDARDLVRHKIVSGV
jgi:peptidoglycan/LPS O-acetylase OafA/YrhL